MNTITANRILLLTALPVMLSFGGCAQLQSALSGPRMPGTSINDIELQNLDMNGVTLLIDCNVTNPYDFKVPLLDMDYGFGIGGETFLTGKGDIKGTLPAGGTKRFKIPATITFRELLAAVTSVKAGDEVEYLANLNVFYDAPGVGRKNWPVSRSGKLPVPAIPQIEIADIEWTKLELTGADAVVRLKITNPNQFGFDINKLSYDLSLGGAQVARSSLRNAASFESGGMTEVEFPISFSPIKFGLAVFNMLNGSSASYEIAGDLDVKTPYGKLDMPYSRRGSARFR